MTLSDCQYTRPTRKRLLGDGERFTGIVLAKVLYRNYVSVTARGR